MWYVDLKKNFIYFLALFSVYPWQLGNRIISNKEVGHKQCKRCDLRRPTMNTVVKVAFLCQLLSYYSIIFVVFECVEMGVVRIILIEILLADTDPH